jgi:hypothetical protein
VASQPQSLGVHRHWRVCPTVRATVSSLQSKMQVKERAALGSLGPKGGKRKAANTARGLATTTSMQVSVGAEEKDEDTHNPHTPLITVRA